MAAEFKTDLLRGQNAETEFHNLFPGLERLDGRLADFRTSDGKLVELKSDFYDHERTLNHFIEVYSYGEKAGGPFQSEANNVDYFVYWHPRSQHIYVYYVNELCGYLRTTKCNDDLIEIKNTRHVTRGWKVPRRDVKHLNLGTEVLK